MPDGRMTLGGHLGELRHRLLISALAIVAATIAAFVVHGTILHALTSPYCSLPNRYRLVDTKCTLVVTGVLDAFTVTLKLSVYTGLIAAAPVWLYQLWRFITPGLYSHERRYAASFVASSMALFALGGLFAWLTLEKGLRFLLGFATGGVSALLSFDSYLSFVVAMVLVFAVSFEFPLLVVALNLVGVLPAAKLKGWTRGIIVGIFAFAAVATPSQDPFTMLALAVPLTLLYLVSYFVAVLHDRRATKRDGPSLYEPVTDQELAQLDEDTAPVDDDAPLPR